MGPDEGYAEARRFLKVRFGNDFVITEAWVSKVTEGPSIKPTDKERLQELADDLQNCTTTLRSMGHLGEVNSQKTLVKIVQRCPMYVYGRWQREAWKIRNVYERNPDIDDLTKFIIVVAEQANDPLYGSVSDTSRKPNVRLQKRSASYSTNVQDVHSASDDKMSSGGVSHTDVCPLCSGTHSLFGCKKFKDEMRPSERRDFVAKKRLCFNCLNAGHFSDKCGLRRTCSVPECGQKHTKFLHLIGNRGAGSAESQQKADSDVTEVKSAFVVMDASEAVCGLAGAGQCLRTALPILPVVVRNPETMKTVQTYALLDTGSTNTFCSEALLRDLQMEGTPRVLSLTTLEKADHKVDTSIVNLEVSALDAVSYLDLPTVFTRPTMPVSLDDMGQTDSLDQWPHLREIKIPHVDAGSVSLLIGQDNPDALIPVDIKRGNQGEPYATKTVLDWALNGPLGGTRGLTATSSHINADLKLEDQLEKFWHIEGSDALVNDVKEMSFEDKKVLAFWEEKIKHQDDGHYELPIPFRQRPPALPYNRQMAEERLRSLKRRLLRDDQLRASYVTYMEDLEKDGYCERVPSEEVDKSDVVWYLPHHPVTNPRKPDKVRIVFDCAATYKGTSLNDQVLQGPDLANALVGVLLRFRQGPVALMADVEAMFHQVRVDPQDCDVLRYLWWPNGRLDEEPVAYRVKVHIFGGTWSPSCCIYTLRRTALDHRDSYDDITVDTVVKDFYVDDCLKSLEEEQQAIRLVKQVQELTSRGGFRLTKWVSNSRAVMETIDKDDQGKQLKALDLNFEALPTERALGVCWNVESDCFEYKIVLRDKPLSRRGLLSIVSSIYDPMGFVCPFVLRAKKVIQNLTQAKLGWDEPLPEKELSLWLDWKEELPNLETLQISRCVRPQDFGPVTSVQLHHFADASEIAYGAVTYMRLEDGAGNVHCCILMAKSRLAPIKKMTIPRLELAAATVSVTLDVMLRRELSMPIDTSWFWTDSTLVLQYISSEDRRFKTYVANRVAAIRSNSTPGQWRHIESTDNPADDLSRGLPARELHDKTRWLEGPSFLRQAETSWPAASLPCQTLPKDDPEVKASSCLQQEKSESVIDKLIHGHSSWYRLKKSVAWLMRLRACLLAKAKGVPKPAYGHDLALQELEAAETIIVKYVQGQTFAAEIKVLRGSQKGQLKKNKVFRSGRLYRLDPILSPDGVLLVGGRLQRAPLPMASRHQMILPGSHHIVDLIIRECHRTTGHMGREYVLSVLRLRYWILGARTTIRRVLRDCIDCRRHHSPLGGQQMSQLPEYRVTPGAPPFSFTGTDYFGTFYVKRGRATEKRYGCIFTCLAIRAIHIEVTHSLDTSSFIHALQRFVSRRGQPRLIASDNGTNFVGGERELREAINGWNQKNIKEFLHQKGIEWRFNPPAASHMGGVWERQIRTVRKVLRSVMTEQIVDDEALSTLMCLVEGIVNSRPLTAVSDDPEDFAPLTPNHLLMLNANVVLPPGVFTKDDIYRARWRRIQYLADLFWRRWVREYLPALQVRQKWQEPKRSFQVGDVVLVLNENTPRNLWPLARVEKVFPGRDGLVRSVEVKTQTGNMVRPVQKLCLMETAGRE